MSRNTALPHEEILHDNNKILQELQMLSHVTLFRGVAMNLENDVFRNAHNKCLKGHKFLGSLFDRVLSKCLPITLVKCLEGDKSLWLLFEDVL